MTGIVAAFDFDGTVTRRDTLVPFLRGMAPSSRLLRGARRSLAAVGERHADRRRDLVKATMVRAVFEGRDVEEVAAAARSYALTLPNGFRADTLERVAWHRDQDHRLVLVSASLAMYARPAVEALGFSDVLAVELETCDGSFTGAMTGPNVRGPEKALGLRALLGDRIDELWAYGNSTGDDAMLAMADHAIMVRRGRLVDLTSPRRNVRFDRPD